MSTVIHLSQRQQRLDAEQLSRSEAMNRTLVEANTTIEQLQADLKVTRITAFFALVVMGYALFVSLTQGAL